MLLCVYLCENMSRLWRGSAEARRRRLILQIQVTDRCDVPYLFWYWQWKQYSLKEQQVQTTAESSLIVNIFAYLTLNIFRVYGYSWNPYRYIIWYNIVCVCAYCFCDTTWTFCEITKYGFRYIIQQIGVWGLSVLVSEQLVGLHIWSLQP